MKKVFESELRGFDESACKIFVYELEDEVEQKELYEMEHEELCSLFNVFDEGRYEMPPGERYSTYYFDFAGGYLIMTETVALNV